MPKKKVFWLEDNQETNKEVAAIIEEGCELIACSDLREFAVALKTNIDCAEDICAFIIDVLLVEHDLSDLGLPEISTEYGLTAGYQVLKYCLLEHKHTKDEEYPKVAQNFAHCKILVLSVLSSPEDTKEVQEIKELNGERVSFIVKRPDSSDNWLKELRDWLNLRN